MPLAGGNSEFLRGRDQWRGTQVLKLYPATGYLSQPSVLLRVGCCSRTPACPTLPNYDAGTAIHRLLPAPAENRLTLWVLVQLSNAGNSKLGAVAGDGDRYWHSVGACLLLKKGLERKKGMGEVRERFLSKKGLKRERATTTEELLWLLPYNTEKDSPDCSPYGGSVPYHSSDKSETSFGSLIPKRSVKTDKQICLVIRDSICIR